MTASLALALALGACEVLSDDPPLDGSGDAEYCAPTPKDGLIAFGAGTPRNRSTSDLQVTKVELVDPVGMELVGSKLMFSSIEGPTDGVGAMYGWPPDFAGDESLEKHFAQSPSIEGAVIPPSTKSEPSFVVGVRAEKGGRSGPLRVTYLEGDKEWTWTGAVTLRTADGDACSDL